MRSQSQGRLVTWKPDKGFGFIRPDDGSKDVFVHVRDFGNIPRSPQIGDVIRYQRIRDRAGRHRAADVQIEGLSRNAASGGKRVRRSRYKGETGATPRSMTFASAIAATFALALIALSAFGELPVIVPALYAVASLIAFKLYGFDKAAAMNRRQRIREITLLLAGLLGGWPGALVAQSLFRHKSRKIAFLVPFWISVAVNCAFLAWACTERGAAAIRLAIY